MARPQRTTLVVAWWGVELQPQPGAPGTGPARQMPTAGQPPWLSDFPVPATGSSGPPAGKQEWVPVPPIAPAWVRTPGQRCDEGSRPAPGGVQQRSISAQLPLPPLRFFLRSASDIRSTYC
jgi:hypothetical protein